MLISRRFSSFRMIDCILVLAASQVESSGTHEQLLASDSRYADLFEIQVAGYRCRRLQQGEHHARWPDC
ncbi:MAG: hypothetical protein ACRYGM_19410 [Janthinobacterium lividum]